MKTHAKRLNALRLAFALLVLVSTFVNAGELPKIGEVVDTGPCSYKLTLTTTARHETIWGLWEDVKNWKKYDTILQYSYLQDDVPFAVDAVGYVKARGAPKTRFKLTEVTPGETFVERLALPLWNSLDLKRRVGTLADGTTIFTHEVEFNGPLKGLMYLFLAGEFKKELPLVMARLKAVAEQADTSAPRVAP